MKTKIVNIRNVLLAAVFASAFGSIQAQTQTTTQQDPNQNTAATQTQAPNLQAELNLTPDQIQKWRALNQELRPQEVAGSLRVREAKRALAEVMEAPSPNEELIKQRAKELAEAQSVMTQLQALRQARVLQILTPEQRVKLREIRQRQQALRRAANQPAMNNAGVRPNGLPRNPNTTLKPNQRKLMRQPKR